MGHYYRLTSSILEILRRLDDPIERVRVNALKNLPIFFENVPEPFTKDNYRGHHELIINTLLIHFDDNEEKIQEMVYGKLIFIFITSRLIC